MTKTHCKRGHDYSKRHVARFNAHGRCCAECGRLRETFRYHNDPEYRERKKAYSKKAKRTDQPEL